MIKFGLHRNSQCKVEWADTVINFFFIGEVYDTHKHYMLSGHKKTKHSSLCFYAQLFYSMMLHLTLNLKD